MALILGLFLLFELLSYPEYLQYCLKTRNMGKCNIFLVCPICLSHNVVSQSNPVTVFILKIAPCACEYKEVCVCVCVCACVCVCEVCACECIFGLELQINSAGTRRGQEESQGAKDQ